MNQQSMSHPYNLCKNHMKQYVLIQTVDGQQIEGVIIDLDEDHVYLVTSGEGMERQFYPGFGGPYGYGSGFGYPYGGGLRRLILPLTAIAALSLLPWY
ncbi:hypothetical protein [Halalkalibacillus sediminis]|uniref:hypothetical protein n=1 Tax=Halalkalibacillus sediminis TaxID=2018042 RepID=UPI00269FECFB